jgi:hypothetical protein
VCKILPAAWFSMATYDMPAQSLAVHAGTSHAFCKQFAPGAFSTRPRADAMLTARRSSSVWHHRASRMLRYASVDVQ